MVSFPRGGGYGPDWTIIRSLFRFGLPTGIQGIAMNIGGVFMLSFIGSAGPERGRAGGVRGVLYAALLADHMDVDRAHGRGGGGRGTEPRRGAGRIGRAQAVHIAARFGRRSARRSSGLFFSSSRQLLAVFGMNEPAVVEIGTQLLRVLSVSGLFIAVALTYTGGLQGTGDTKSPLYISIMSQMLVPLGICFVIKQTGTLQPLQIWLAILAGHATRCVLSVLRFKQGKWRGIAVDIGPTRPLIMGEGQWGRAIPAETNTRQGPS